uniref:Translational initiation factor 1 n=1 Tax=Nicotiana obtusifolia TaxID=200316 RepID=A0A6V8F4P8_9SOLA|nr:TPA_asm: translational initiation factor 1 [Nicotiana obtusifolia]
MINYVSGKIRHSFIRILPGDRVKIEVSPYDSTKGRIIYRLHNKDFKDSFFNFTIPFVGIQFEMQNFKKLIFFQEIDSELR